MARALQAGQEESRGSTSNRGLAERGWSQCGLFPRDSSWDQDANRPLLKRSPGAGLSLGRPRETEPPGSQAAHGGGRGVQVCQVFPSTLMLVRVSTEDEAIYQCVAENSTGSNQASARLAVTGPGATPCPQGPSGNGSLQLCHWSVLGSAPLRQGCHGLCAAPPACGSPRRAGLLHHGAQCYLRAGLLAAATPARAHPGLQTFPPQLPAAHFEGPLLLPSNVSSFLYTHLEPAALYEIKLQAFNGNGDGDSSACFVSLRDVPLVTTESQAECSCSRDESSPLPGVVVGVHVGLAAIIVCLLCLLLGWRHSVLCRQGSRQCFRLPRTELRAVEARL